jgi:hypothetical protein
MPNYRIYLTRQPAQDITSDTDAEALIKARVLVEDYGFEVWQGERLVASVDRQRRTGGSAARYIENNAARASPVNSQDRGMSNFNRAVEALCTLKN